MMLNDVVVYAQTYAAVLCVQINICLKLLKYEHIRYHFKARDLEIPLI